MLVEFIPDLEQRFWQRVEITDGECWPWTGALDPKGYGYLSLRHSHYFAHRISWCIHQHASIPADMHVCHSCDNPPCVNPDHLWLGTHLNNMRDAFAKGRMDNRFPPKETCRNGHRLDDANLYLSPEGWRRCHACDRARTAAYSRRKRSADREATPKVYRGGTAR